METDHLCNTVNFCPYCGRKNSHAYLDELEARERQLRVENEELEARVAELEAKDLQAQHWSLLTDAQREEAIRKAT